MPKRKKVVLPRLGDPTQAWMFKAKSDLRAAKNLLKDPLALDAAIYHTQQCAEKAFKAYLAFKLQPIQKTHNLIELVMMCNQFDCRFKEKILKNAIILNPYCFKFRYPDDIMLPDEKDVIEAIEHAKNILNFVKNKIDEMPNPTKFIFD